MEVPGVEYYRGMKETRLIMGMPIEIEIPDIDVAAKRTLEAVFAYLVSVDEEFSTASESSEISRINRGELPLDRTREKRKKKFTRAEKTKRETNGYFDIFRPASHPAPGNV